MEFDKIITGIANMYIEKGVGVYAAFFDNEIELNCTDDQSITIALLYPYIQIGATILRGGYQTYIELSRFDFTNLDMKQILSLVDFNVDGAKHAFNLKTIDKSLILVG